MSYAARPAGPRRFAGIISAGRGAPAVRGGNPSPYSENKYKGSLPAAQGGQSQAKTGFQFEVSF